MSQPERKKVIEKSALGYFSDKIKAWVSNLLNGKVDKVTGKQLSTEDYTTAEKTKLASALTTANVVDNLTSTSTTAPLSANQRKALNDVVTSLGKKFKITVQDITGSADDVTFSVAERTLPTVLLPKKMNGYCPICYVKNDIEFTNRKIRTLINFTSNTAGSNLISLVILNPEKSEVTIRADRSLTIFAIRSDLIDPTVY